MVNLLISFFLSYILTLSGYLLGKSTKEEHSEIKSKILFFRDVLVYVFYLSMFYVFRDSVWIFFIIILLFLFLLGRYVRKEIKEFHDIAVFSALILLFNLEFEHLYLFILIVWTLILEKSLENFIIKKEIYSLVALAIIYFIFSLIF